MKPAPRYTIQPIIPSQPQRVESILSDWTHDIGSGCSIILFILAAIAVAITIGGPT